MTVKASDIGIISPLGCLDYFNDDDISQTASNIPATELPLKFWGRANTVKTDSGDEKRGGFIGYPSLSVSAQAAVLIGQSLYYTTSAQVFRYTGGVSYLIGSYPSNQGNVSEMIASSDGAYIFIKNGASGWYVNVAAGTLYAITDTVYTSMSHVTTGNSAGYLDGTFYVLDSKGNIWGSKVINSPVTWDATNVTPVNTESSEPVALKVYKQYLVVFKRNSTQVFYDASNPQGSPLLPIQSIRIQYGCVNWSSVSLVGDSMFWVGRRDGGTPVVLEMNGTSLREVSTDPVNKALQYYLESGYSSGGSTPPLYNIFQGAQVYHQGQPLYVVGMGYTSQSCLVYNPKKQDWNVWTTNVSNLFPIRNAVNQPVTSDTNSWEPLYMSQNIGFATYSKAYNADAPSGTGGGYTKYDIVAEWITPPLAFDTDRYKVAARLTLFTSMASSGRVEACWSDDDMASWSGWQEMDLVDGRHSLFDMGSFRVRYYRIRHRGNQKVCVVKSILEYVV